jgi:MFS family permease
MSARATPIDAPQRRRALALGHVNGALWSIGNGLTTGPLVIYLAQDLDAQGLALGLVLATPNLAGLLRLAAPAIIYRLGTAKRACLGLSLASYVLIVGLPLIALAAPVMSRAPALATMIGLLFVHQLLEYLGTVALWSWWSDLVPLKIRGRYFARRQMIQLAVLIPTLLASGYFADNWRGQYRDQPELLLVAYAVPTGVGALFLLGSLLPLALMPATRRYEMPPARLMGSTIAAPFVDRRFWRLLAFRIWFSLSNGISQTVQGIYPKQVLGFGIGDLAVMRTVMQFGQMGASRPVGRFSDRYGNRPVLMVAQACVSASLLFFIVARDAQTRWLLVGAWVLFSAYVAHNICLPNLVLKLAPSVEKSAYIATHEALGSLFHAAATIGGGMLFDWLRATSSEPDWEPYRSCVIILAAGVVMRSLGVALLAAIIEPGAWTWRQILAAHFNPLPPGEGGER